MKVIRRPRSPHVAFEVVRRLDPCLGWRVSLGLDQSVAGRASPASDRLRLSRGRAAGNHLRGHGLRHEPARRQRGPDQRSGRDRSGPSGRQAGQHEDCRDHRQGCRARRARHSRGNPWWRLESLSLRRRRSARSQRDRAEHRARPGPAAGRSARARQRPDHRAGSRLLPVQGQGRSDTGLRAPGPEPVALHSRRRTRLARRLPDRLRPGGNRAGHHRRLPPQPGSRARLSRSPATGSTCSR